MKTKNVLVLLSSLAILASCGSNTNPPVKAGKKRNNVITEEAAKDSSTSASTASTTSSSEEQTKKALALSSQRTVELQEDFSNLEEVKAELNNFKVEAKLEKPLDVNAVFKCFKVKNKINVNFEEKTLHIGYTKIAIDVALEKDEPRVDVTCQILNGKKEIIAAQLTLLKSVVVEAPTDFQDLLLNKGAEAYEVDRLIIADRGELLFGNQDAVVSVNELFSDKGAIKTFAKADAVNAKPGLPGKSGAKLTFNVKKSSGILSATLIGKDGDKQTIIAGKGLPGKKGTNAIADITKDYEECTEGGPGPGHRNPFCRKIPEVITLGSAAGKGSDGEKGAKGEKGNAGGNSGSLNYTTQTASESFDLKIQSSAGMGSVGGEGGEGGAGGLGGDAAGKYAVGATGAVGLRGDQGLAGEPGLKEISCVKILSESANCLTKI